MTECYLEIYDDIKKEWYRYGERNLSLLDAVHETHILLVQDFDFHIVDADTKQVIYRRPSWTKHEDVVAVLSRLPGGTNHHYREEI